MVESKSKNIQAKVLGFLSVACLSLIIILLSFWSMNKAHKESDFIIKNIFPSKIYSMEVLASLINQQTGVSAYIISRQKVFLEPYYLGNIEIQRYSNSMNNLKKIGVNVEIINRLNEQTKSIQLFLRNQVTLVDNGKYREAELNIKQGKDLIDEYRATNNILTNKIDFQLSNSREKAADNEKIHLYLMSILGIIFLLVNFIFIWYIRTNWHKKIKKENQINGELQKLLTSQEKYIANISHELKTPLNVIFAAVQLLDMNCKNGSLDEKKDLNIKYIDSIKQNSYRLSKLIDNIVDTSKIDAGLFEMNVSNNNIVQVVEDIVMSSTAFTVSKGINIIFDTNIEEKFTACDPEKIERVVLNLISNAMKFSNKGDEIEVDIKDKNEFIEIAVKDNGIGIERKNLDTIFDKFNKIDKSLSRNAEGMGIGLSLVKSIVELSGGSIKAESEFGKGSKFTVKLPSENVLSENVQFSNILKSGKDRIQVEFSDVY